MPQLLITSSGTGSRLGELTRDTNKALIKVGGKEIIAHIIDSYPVDMPIVITLGYHGDKVKNFIETTYPDRNIEFVVVDIFEGLGSSLGYSMLQARTKIKGPFIFHCNDTIVSRFNQSIETNWAAGYKVEDSTQYTTFKVDGDDNVVHYNTKKGAIDFDYAHIGLAGIFEYEIFFQILQRTYDDNPDDSSLNDVCVLAKMLESGSLIKAITIDTWLDTGNPQSLAITERGIKSL